VPAGGPDTSASSSARSIKRISADVKVDLKLASLTLQKTQDPTPARTARLRIVERFIDEHHHVGTIEEPGDEYFRGRMKMQRGWLGYGSGKTLPIVFFKGQADSHIVMLAGSLRHVIGDNPRAVAAAYSSLPQIAAAIDKHIAKEEAEAAAELVRTTHGFSIEQAVGVPDSLDSFEEFTYAASKATMVELKPRTPKQRLDFLAIPLAEDKAKDRHAILGTPLYLATARDARLRQGA
jgi:hypothetical protein